MMPAPHRRLVLGIALLATLAATVWVSRWETGEDVAAVPASQRQPRPPAAGKGARAADSAALTVPAPRTAGEGTITDLFAPRSWRVAPAPAPALPPSAPPLPFTYLGKLIIDGEVVVFVSTPERNFAVRKGDLINGTYRIDRIAPPTLSLTYLPLNEKQTLEIGRAN
ncbi:hypothetical protein [Thauera chlorobenzoica]|uniref:Type II secretion system, translation initiation factor n=1 Tax=Thauera chlorobenzoica TaxID=96773 RepID=A0A1L6FE08_9RHOO|nr:hypothetical protein [Thauera chlorobenzoica]APR05147.1 type II secretion system, translation initiation factor [Thauera chlorobenzoica]